MNFIVYFFSKFLVFSTCVMQNYQFLYYFIVFFIMEGMIGIQWIIFIGIAVVSWLVQMNLQNKFKKYSKIPTGNGMTGRDVALQMLHDNGIYDVQVTHTPGQLTDHYNPANKTVNLSE